LVPIHNVISDLESRLRAAGTPERAVSEKKYLKSDLTFLGAAVPKVRAITRDFRKANPRLTHEELAALVAELWSKPIHEFHAAAIELLWMYRKLLLPEDMTLIERMLRTSYTWAYVDALAGPLVGELVERYPELNKTLDRWASDKDFWVRRSALLALDRPMRRGGGDWPRFVRYADPMLEEKEFFIRKAIGWVLREVSKKQPELVCEYLTSPRRRGEPPRGAIVSGVTLREALRYLAQGQRDSVLALRQDHAKAGAAVR
jgi:3-methyladenine DNA glycosylase AlkD